jgi:hypothetical protein
MNIIITLKCNSHTLKLDNENHDQSDFIGVSIMMHHCIEGCVRIENVC